VADPETVERFPTSAAAGPPPLGDRARLLVQRGLLGVLALVVLAACLGWLGPHSDTVTETGAGGTVRMEYDARTRPGLDTEVVVTLRPDRARESLVLRVPSGALDALGIEQFVPEPVEQRSEDGAVVLEFATSGEPPYEVTLAGRTPTTQPPGRHRWRVEWLEDGSPTAAVAATTWVVP